MRPGPLPHAAALLVLGTAGLLAHDSPLGRGPEDVVGCFLGSPIRSPGWRRPLPRAQDTSAPVLVPFLVDRVRERTTVPGRVWLAEWLRDGEDLRLTQLRILVDRRSIATIPLDLELSGRLELPRAAADLERLPATITHLRRRQFAFLGPGAELVKGPSAEERSEEWMRRFNELEAERGARPPDARVDFVVDLARLFEEDAVPGDRAQLRLELTAEQPGGQKATYFVERVVEWAGPRPPLPAGALEEGWRVVAVDPHVHATDDPRPLPTGCPDLAYPGSFPAAQQSASMKALGLSPHRPAPPRGGFLIWSGEYQVGQEREVGEWVELLARGERVVAYGGSDAHEEPFEAGATHVIVRDEDPASLAEALAAGRSFVSNGPALTIELRVGEQRATLGEAVVRSRDEPLELRLDHAFAPGSGPLRWKVLAGRPERRPVEVELLAGELDGTEAVGTLRFDLALEPGFEGWVRGYAEATEAARSVYTNPIWVRAEP